MSKLADELANIGLAKTLHEVLVRIKYLEDRVAELERLGGKNKFNEEQS